jgi:hypothetical protein
MFVHHKSICATPYTRFSLNLLPKQVLNYLTFNIMNRNFKRILFSACLLAALGGTACSDDTPEQPAGGGTESGETEEPGGEDNPDGPLQMDPVEFAAFPGAEGYGKNTVGGRGGKVYHVTSLDDDANNPAEGTLRWVLKQKGAKTVVFDVAGTIHLKADLKTNNDNLTIAGQTSPGGICLADYAFVINSNEVIIRFLRFRPGDDSGKEPDGLGGMDKKNIIIDHCSVI